ALDQSAGVTRTQGGVLDLHVDATRDLGAGCGGRGRRVVQLRAGERGHLAGDADQRQTAGHVRQNIYFKDYIAEVVGQGHADGGAVVEEDDALVLLVDAEFEGRHHHPLAGDATHGLGDQRGNLLGGDVAVPVGAAGQANDDLQAGLADGEVRRGGDELH